MRGIYYLLCFLVLCCASEVLAGKTSAKEVDCFPYMSDDENIIIQNRQKTITFKKSGDGVVVKETCKTIYAPLRYSARVNDAYPYDSTSEITKLRGVTAPEYQYHQSELAGIFYSDAKVCEINKFAIQKRTVECYYEKQYNNLDFFCSEFFVSHYMIVKEVVKVVVPKWLNMEIHEFNFGKNVTKTVKQKGSGTTYIYTIKYQPSRYDESHMPGPSYIYPHIVFQPKSAALSKKKTVTYFRTIDDLYGWYYSKIQNLDNGDKVVGEQARLIIKDYKTDKEKIQAILSWVQKHIRYVAFEDGIAGFRPDVAKDVLRKKYGDCKGMANLLKTMLVSLGYDARIAWIGTTHKAYNYSTPTLIVDNHAICALFIEDKIYYLDATVEHMPLGEYPHTIQGRQTLIENGDKYILERVPEADALFNTDSLYSEYKLVNGVLEGKIAHFYQGESKQELLSIVNSVSINNLDKALNTYFTNNGTGRTVSNVKLSDCHSSLPQVSISCNIRNTADFQNVKGELYIDIDNDKPFINSDFDLKKRKTDYMFSYKRRKVQLTKIAVPYGYKAILPKPFLIDKDGYKMSLTYEEKDGVVVYKRIVEIKKIILKKTDMEKWNADIRALTKAYLAIPIFK